MIEFKKVSKIYPGNQVAAENINLKFKDGEFICFIGASGSGQDYLHEDDKQDERNYIGGYPHQRSQHQGHGSS